MAMLLFQFAFHQCHCLLSLPLLFKYHCIVSQCLHVLLRWCCIITDSFLIVNSCIIDVAQPIIDKPHVVVSFRELLLIQYHMRVARVSF